MKKICIVLFLICMMISNCSYAKTDETIEEQKETFGISDFIKESQKYKGDFLEDIDMSELMNNAIQGNVDNNVLIKKVIKLFGTEVRSSVKTLISILVIIVIHSVLKAISDSLENNNISEIIYYVQYILIVTVIMSNFNSIIQTVKETSQNLVAFMNMLVPILITLMVYT